MKIYLERDWETLKRVGESMERELELLRAVAEASDKYMKSNTPINDLFTCGELVDALAAWREMYKN